MATLSRVYLEILQALLHIEPSHPYPHHELCAVPHWGPVGCPPDAWGCKCGPPNFPCFRQFGRGQWPPPVGLSSRTQYFQQVPYLTDGSEGLSPSPIHCSSRDQESLSHHCWSWVFDSRPTQNGFSHWRGYCHCSLKQFWHSWVLYAFLLQADRHRTLLYLWWVWVTACLPRLILWISSPFCLGTTHCFDSNQAPPTNRCLQLFSFQSVTHVCLVLTLSARLQYFYL